MAERTPSQQFMDLAIEAVQACPTSVSGSEPFGWLGVSTQAGYVKCFPGRSEVAEAVLDLTGVEQRRLYGTLRDAFLRTRLEIGMRKVRRP